MNKEELLKFYAVYKLYIFPIAVALSSIFLIAFIIYPQTVKLFNNQKAAGKLADKLEFLETKISVLEGFDKEDLSSKVKYTLDVFPVEKDYGNIVGLLQKISSESGFNIAAINISDAGSETTGSSSYRIQMQAGGAKSLLPAFLNNLEKSPRLMKIDAIEISSSQQTQSIEASFTISALYAPMPASFGLADTSLPQISQKEEELLASLTTTIEAGSGLSVFSPVGKSNPFE